MRRHKLALALAATALAWAASGCLEAGRGQVATDTRGADAAATDTVPADAAATDTASDLCLGQSCDDNDPCTWDQCDPATGACQHLAVPSTGGARVQGCGGDWDCDDGDPCTADICARSSDGCGIAWSGCEHHEVPGCGACQTLGCPWGGPCVVGTCHDDGSCSYATTPGCGSACNSLDALTPTQARAQLSAGQPAKVAGTVAPNAAKVCLLGGGCACVREPALVDEAGGNFTLYTPDPGNGDDSAWFCREDTCGASEVPACAPVHYGGAYWVWGTASEAIYTAGTEVPPASDPLPPAPPLPPVDGLIVTDYCLQTNAQGLPGIYTVTLTSFALSAEVSLIGTVVADADGTLSLTLREPDCRACGTTATSGLFPQTVAVEAGDGWIAFDFTAPTICSAITNMAPPRATLYSQRNQLVGTFHDSWGDGAPSDSDGDVAYCSYGTLTFARLP